MARGSRRGRRDTSAIAKRSLPRLSPIKPFRSPSTYLREYEDRRYFHPEGVNRPAASFRTPRHRLTVVDRQTGLGDLFASLRAFPDPTNAIVAFQEPNRVLVCVRRKQREEVLHALGKTGRGGQKSPRYNWTSNISCKE